MTAGELVNFKSFAERVKNFRISKLVFKLVICSFQSFFEPETNTNWKIIHTVHQASQNFYELEIECKFKLASFWFANDNRYKYYSPKYVRHDMIPIFLITNEFWK